MNTKWPRFNIKIVLSIAEREFLYCSFTKQTNEAFNWFEHINLNVNVISMLVYKENNSTSGVFVRMIIDLYNFGTRLLLSDPAIEIRCH